jgi:hypothetical protein
MCVPCVCPVCVSHVCVPCVCPMSVPCVLCRVHFERLVAVVYLCARARSGKLAPYGRHQSRSRACASDPWIKRQCTLCHAVRGSKARPVLRGTLAAPCVFVLVTDAARNPCCGPSHGACVRCAWSHPGPAAPHPAAHPHIPARDEDGARAPHPSPVPNILAVLWQGMQLLCSRLEEGVGLGVLG